MSPTLFNYAIYFVHERALQGVQAGGTFTLPSCSHLRGHDLKLRHRSFHLARRKAAFSVRIVEPWNELPPFVIDSPSVVVFKNLLDACWKTIFGSDAPQ